MSKENLYIRGLGDITIDDIEHSYYQQLLEAIREYDESFYSDIKDKQLIVIHSDGSKENINERIHLSEYINCELEFVDLPKAKPQIRIRSRSEEQINFVEEDFPTSHMMQPSYKNNEVSFNTNIRLVLDTNSVDAILSTIEWDTESSINTVEQAGLLVGNRCKDSNGGVWGKVTNIIPLKETPSSRRGILMTSDSFFEASNRDFPLLKEKNPALEIIGWYHTHTFNDQPVFSGTDYQTQSTTFASNKAWFALVLNAQQRTFSAYYDRNAILINSFLETSEEIESRWRFGINEKYFGAEQKAKIKKGTYEIEQQKAELERQRKELEEKEKSLKRQENNIKIQRQRLEQDRRDQAKSIADERKRMEKVLSEQRRRISTQQADLRKQENHLDDIQEMLKRIFPLAYEPNNGLFGFGRYLFPDPIRVRRIPPSGSLPIDSSLDVFFESRNYNRGFQNNIANEIKHYGTLLNAIRHMIKVLTNVDSDYCAVVSLDPNGERFLVHSIIPVREIRNINLGNALIFAMDRYEQNKVNRVIDEIIQYYSRIQLYVYIEETQVVYKKS